MTSKKYLSTLLLLLCSLASSWGQAVTTAPATNTSGFSDLMTTAFLIASVVLFVIVIAVVVRTNALLTRHLIRLESEKHGIFSTTENLPQPFEEDFITRLRKKYWENAVPIEREAEITIDHGYDGIRELDNHLPPWWVNMFILTVLWAIGYMWYYHWGGSGLNQADEYKTEVAAAKKQIEVVLAGKANSVDESSVTLMTDAAALSEGELTFKSVCAACHGQKGEGLVGPNFTDEYWIHGGGIKNVFKTIKYGVPEKGMISWASQLKPVDIQKVASYILTLKGSNPANPKAAQGTVWTDEASVSQDTSSAKKG